MKCPTACKSANWHSMPASAIASVITMSASVFTIFEAQLAKTEAQLAELTAFRSDQESNIDRMKSLINHAQRSD